MLLRAMIVMLVMLNLGVGIWWAVRPSERAEVAATTARADAPTLRLLNEAPPPVASPAPAAVDAVTTPQVAATPAVETPAAPAPVPEPEAPVQAAPVCLRFGPFDSTAARDAARNTLAGLGVQGVPRESTARPARGWKVSIAPQASREAAVALAERIKAAGVSDLYVMGEGDDTNSIALGRYGSEDAARRREADLRAKGFPAQAAPLGAVPIQAWLDARLPDGVSRDRVAGVAAARSLDCAGLR